MKTEMIKMWQDHNVRECIMTFDCGGDNMGDTNFVLYDKNDDVVECQELIDYLDDQVYKEVEFYVNSDGHYQGEFGTVTITLEDEGEEDYEFVYSKSSQSNWSETFTEVVDIPLKDNEVEFLKEKVLSVVGGDGTQIINYKIDCILTDEEEQISEDLMKLIDQTADDHTFENEEGEASSWFNFTTNLDDEENMDIKLVGNTLKVQVSRSFDVIKDEE
jgi:hypothetical protein